MTREQLDQARRRLEDDIVDAEEMAAFHLANASSHVPGHERQAAADRVERMRERVGAIAEQLERLAQA